MLISYRLKLLREKLLLTQEEFANYIGVCASTVNRWETGKVRPNISAMKNIKRVCEDNDYPYEDIEQAWLSH